MQILVGENNKILRNKSAKIDKIDKSVKKLIKEMKTTMKKNKGVGLAAPQVGINQKLITVLLDEKKILAMVNPEILEQSTKTLIAEEGCLSLPGTWANVERPKEIKVKFWDEKEKTNILILKGMNARIVLHEVDHLDGVLFIDKMIRKNLVTESFEISK